MNLERLLEELGIDQVDFIDRCNTPEEAVEMIQTAISEREIVYYGRAIDYLAENDPSFVESLALASEMGYELSSLNSEILATLHWQNYLTETLEDVLEAINELFS